MGKARQKTVKGKRRSRRAAPVRWWRRIGRLALLLVGVFLGLMVPWVAYLNHQVTSEFEGRKWDLPSRVFARPLELYPGAPLDLQDLELELRVAGYQRLERADQPGLYRVAGNTVTIYRRAFRFPDGAAEARRIEVRLAAGSIGGVRDLIDGRNIDLVRLDPAEIASIYPLHKEDRTLVSIGDVPPLLVTGLQAMEDRRFKQHPGIDLRGIGRAFMANLRAGRAVQGGSTLTQQLVKNFFLTRDRTVARKLNEAIMALLLEYHYDKGEILEAYVNEVFLGQHGAYAVHGFARASQFYFGQPLERLQPQQIALLVGLVKGPSYYNPRRHPERARQRRDQVLDAFVETGLLSPAEAATAQAAGLGVTATPGYRGSRYPAFIDLVRQQLGEVYREDDLRREGLRIFTTLSPVEQEKAQAAVSRGLRQLAGRGLPADLQGALVLADAASGEVRALVGDRDGERAGFNRALHARRQIGSIIKPLVYLLALEHEDDYNLLTRIEDQPVTLRLPEGGTWQPANYDGVSHGSVTLLEALTKSYNQATVRLGMNIGVTHLLARLDRLGIDAEVNAVPSVFLGAVELTPLEVTQLFQSVAAGGFSVPLRAVLAVATPEGGELVRYPLRLLPQPRRDALGVLNFALTQVVEQGTAARLPALLGGRVTVAGKTGTTNDRRDSWFVGYTRDRVATAWVGHDDNRPAGVTGSNAAMQVWAALFRELPIESVDLRLPDGASWLWVDRVSGRLSAEQCGGAEQIPFVEGSEPREMTPCLAATRDDKRNSIWRKLFGKKQ